MREFIVIAHDAPLDASVVSLDDLPGSAGRLDLLCRCITSSLLTSHGMRSNTAITVILQDELAIRFSGDELRGLHPDERSTAARFRDALAESDSAIGAIPAEPAPGITVMRAGIEATIESAAGRVIQLHPTGDPIHTLDPENSVTLVLSDHHPFTPGDETVIGSHRDAQISVGPEALHADQAITVAHNYLDTGGYEDY